ncbi:retropepsin-like aspartic protease family protein [Sphingomonas alpina]|uniref:TIGR02281 family clan AA aspartic protease n=1 Tax=Sphingomonas alpina TaxID=653931 RepID=A0A7H0LGG1_9SPHN|nr:TIGR02281 family clan AA aspartic protease [Sphingomonas alpina]QNQ08764.1 TIGR02281 family clan AA aspartic protease [Sphingomonas alpina]
MKIALAIMAVTGIAIGLAVPTAKPKVAAAPAAQPEGAVPVRDVPVETVLDRSPSGSFVAIADVNDEPIRFVVDTGADTVALTVEDAKRAHIVFDPSQFQVVGRGASGDVRGQEVRIADIVLDGKRATDVRAVVLEGSDMSLLGHTYLRRLKNVQISNDKMTLR